MSTLDQPSIDFLFNEPAFRLFGRGDRARLLMNVHLRELAAGDTLFDRATPPDQVFLIREGEIDIQRGHDRDTKRSGFLGGELVLGARAYQSSAVATRPSVVYAFSVPYLSGMTAAYASVKSMLFDAYSGAGDTLRTKEKEASAVTSHSQTLPATDGFGVQMFGWLAATALPLLIWQLCTTLGLNKDAAYFVSIVSCAVAMWLFNLVPAFIPPLFSILAFILFDIAPPSVALAGFASNGFFMLLSIFSIGALMAMSGLTYRISLHILRIVPATPFWYNISLFLYGLVLTPVIPSQLGRTTIIAPFLSTLIDNAGGQKKDPAVAQLIVSAMAGVGLTASIFLTGKPANLIVFGLFDTQTQFAYQWLQWLLAASMTGVVLVLLYVGMVRLLFRHAHAFSIPKHLVNNQVRVLGPMSAIEWGAVAAIALIVAGIFTAPWHKVDVPWMSMTVFVTLLLFGAIRRDDLSTRIDWSVLIFIASIIAWAPVMHLTGIDALVSSSFSWIGVYMKQQLPLFILALCAAIVLIRFALPEIVAEILLVTLLLPLAAQSGVSPWLIGFIILTMCEAYIFPYQAPYHIQLKNLLGQVGQEGLYDERKVIRFNVLMTLIRVAAIYASLPFWKYLDIV